MSSLTDSIRQFIEETVEPRLAAKVASFVRDKGVAINLRFVETPQMVARVEANSDGYCIVLARGWFLRVGLALTVVERMWETLAERPAVLALNFNSVFDDYFFGIECSTDFNFAKVPDLAPLFVETLSEAELAARVASFESIFNERQGGDKGLLDFRLSVSISQRSADRLLVCCEFLLLHEIAHATRGHLSFIGETSYAALNEISKQRVWKSYRKKAAEVDADSYAIATLVRERMDREHIVDLRTALADVLTPVLLLIAFFDIGRRTIHEYQGMFASHPLPDVRAIAACHVLAAGLGEFGVNLDELVLQCRDEAIKYCIESFQRLGIPVGGYYVIGNRLVSLDDQFTSELAVVGIIRDELSAIHEQYCKLEARGVATTPVWNHEPFGMTAAEVRKVAKETALAMFERRNVLREGDMDRIMSTRIEEARRRLESRPGTLPGSLIMTQHTPESMDSPFLKAPGGWSTEDGANFLSDETHRQYERVMGNIMRLLFDYAEVEAVAP